MSLFHYQLKQVKNGLSCRFFLRVSENEAYEIKLPSGINRRCARFELNGTEKFRLDIDMAVARQVRSQGIGAHKSALLAVKDENRETVGDVYSCCSKVWFGYEFYAAHFFGREFTAYEIGLGKEGIKIPVYRETRQIAEISKEPVVINNKDVYDLYLSDSQDLVPVMILALYYDLMNFGNNGEVSLGKETVYVTTKNKELLEKYNPDFVLNG